MSLIKWVLWRRWLFRHWLSKVEFSSETVNNCYKCNFAGCRDYPWINRDMAMIASKLRGA